MIYIGILCIALLLFGVSELLIILRTLNRMLGSLAREIEEAGPEKEGMDLMLLKPKPKRKAHRFTDKSRDWITAKETASRR